MYTCICMFICMRASSLSSLRARVQVHRPSAPQLKFYSPNHREALRNRAFPVRKAKPTKWRPNACIRRYATLNPGNLH